MLFSFRSVFALAVFGVASLVMGAPVETSFEYQGVLDDGGIRANGLYDIAFQLFDDAGAGVGPTYLDNDVLVSDGLFSVTVMLGELFSEGERLHLEVRIRQAGGTTFTTLSPRTLILPTPYSTHALEAGVSLDNEWARNGEIVSSGDTNDRVLINPDLTAGSLLNANGVFQVNFDRATFGGMWMNSQNSGGSPFYGFSSDNALIGWIDMSSVTGDMNLWNSGTIAPSLSVADSKVTAAADLVVGEDVQIDGVMTKDYGTNQYRHVSPTAYGVFRQNGTRDSGTPNITAVWNAVGEWYELTIAGESISFLDDSAFVTPQGLTPLIATTGSFSGKLLVYLTNLSGNRVQGPFQVIVYDNEPVAEQ